MSDLLQHDPKVVKRQKWLKDAMATERDGCILWPFGRNSNGYGVLRHEGKTVLAYRLVLVLTTGSDQSEMDAAHYCRNRHCINRRHLRWATPKENTADRRRDGTNGKKLDERQAAEIRGSAGSRREIARRFGVSHQMVSLIKGAKSWRPVYEA